MKCQKKNTKNIHAEKFYRLNQRVKVKIDFFSNLAAHSSMVFQSFLKHLYILSAHLTFLPQQ